MVTRVHASMRYVGEGSSLGSVHGRSGNGNQPTLDSQPTRPSTRLVLRRLPQCLASARNTAAPTAAADWGLFRRNGERSTLYEDSAAIAFQTSASVGTCAGMSSGVRPRAPASHRTARSAVRSVATAWAKARSSAEVASSAGRLWSTA